jgi:hypothetical protein
MLAVTNRAAALGPQKFSWWQDWRDRCCAIVASGPSAKGAPLDQLRGTPTIVINESHRLCPWAEVLYGCDAKWWKQQKGVSEFKGVKIAWEGGSCDFPDIQKIKIKDKMLDRLLVDEPGVLGSGGNSGFQALNLAIQFGSLRVLLVGFDMQGEGGDHWHGRHRSPLTNPMAVNYSRWKSAFEACAPMLRDIGVEVVNCSGVSSLQCFPKMTLPGALARWRL